MGCYADCRERVYSGKGCECYPAEGDKPMTRPLSERMAEKAAFRKKIGMVDDWLEDAIAEVRSLEQSAKDYEDLYRGEVRANARLEQLVERYEKALHPGPMPVNYDPTPRVEYHGEKHGWFYANGDSTAAQWCVLANLYEQLTGKRIEEQQP